MRVSERFTPGDSTQPGKFSVIGAPKVTNRIFVDCSPQYSVSTPSQTVIGTDAAVVLYSNPKRKGFTIQNTGTTVIKLGIGTAPTQTVYHVALVGGTGADDATGGLWADDAWVGDVWIISSEAGGTCVVSEYRTGSPDWNLSGDWGR